VKIAEVVCTYCGETIQDKDEAADPRKIDNEIICEECWRRLYAFSCCICENYEENDLQRTHVVVIDSAEAFGVEYDHEKKRYRVRRPRGIYQVLECPYYAAPLIGGGSLDPGALKRIAPLPKNILPRDYYEYPCGHLCRDCLAVAAPKLKLEVVGPVM